MPRTCVRSNVYFTPAAGGKRLFVYAAHDLRLSPLQAAALARIEFSLSVGRFYRDFAAPSLRSRSTPYGPGSCEPKKNGRFQRARVHERSKPLERYALRPEDARAESTYLQNSVCNGPARRKAPASGFLYENQPIDPQEACYREAWAGLGVSIIFTDFRISSFLFLFISFVTLF
jgi:hypothetical protein